MFFMVLLQKSSLRFKEENQNLSPGTIPLKSAEVLQAWLSGNFFQVCNSTYTSFIVGLGEIIKGISIGKCKLFAQK